MTTRRIREGTANERAPDAEEPGLTVALTEQTPIGAGPNGGVRDERSTPGSTDFDVVYRTHRQLVMNVARGVIGPAHADELEDVVQAVFIEVYRCLPRFEGRSKLTTWLYRICVNVSLQHLRKRRRRRWLVLSDTGDQPGERIAGSSPSGRLEGRALLERVYELASRLSKKKHVVWNLHDIQGLTPREIAVTLDVPHNTVRSRLLAARKDLMALLSEEGLLPEGNDA